jgi:two-component system response regulator YesN
MRKYNIVFADDEEIIRESFLKLVDWEKHNFYVAGVFKDGESVWAYIENNPVDILITDINMPFMDGISIMEHIRDKGLKMHVLFLTGYEYFEYAQKAVQMQVFDFLLKPLSTERLLDAAQRAALDIERMETAEYAVQESLDLSREDFVNQLLHAGIEKEHIKEEAERRLFPTEAEEYRTIEVAVDLKNDRCIPDDETGKLKQELEQMITGLLDEMRKQSDRKTEIYFARNLKVHIQMILVFDSKGTASDDFIRDFSEKIIERGQNRNILLTVIIGRSNRRIENIPDTYRKITYAKNNRHIIGINRIIYASDPIPAVHPADKIVMPLDELLHNIRMGNTELVTDEIRRIYENFRHKEYLSLESAKMATTELAITVFKGETYAGDESVSYLYYLNHIQQLNTLDEMQSDITVLARQITEKRKNGGDRKKRITEKAMEYMNDNYAKSELSLNEIASSLNISVPYLAILFKQETGKNFGNHLLEIRMKKAKELLKTTSDSVSEIAEKVGYASSQYFAVCFKKYTGVTPGYYRDK